MSEPAQPEGLPAPARRVAEDAAAKGVTVTIVVTESSARSAAEAAAAVGAEVGQIVKSLVFRGRESGKAYLLLVSGSNRVDEALMASMLGEALERPDAAFVRAATGFAIGGVSPFGAPAPLHTFMDEQLLNYPLIWAAAGTPHHVFAIAPEALHMATGAAVGRVS